MRRRVRTPRSKKKKRDLAEQKIDQEIALINANLSMRKCMSSLDRLEKENRMLRNQFLLRLLTGNRKKIRNAFETWRWVDLSLSLSPRSFIAHSQTYTQIRDYTNIKTIHAKVYRINTSKIEPHATYVSSLQRFWDVETVYESWHFTKELGRGTDQCVDSTEQWSKRCDGRTSREMFACSSKT